jgi:hypothetical protein
MRSGPLKDFVMGLVQVRRQKLPRPRDSAIHTGQALPKSPVNPAAAELVPSLLTKAGRSAAGRHRPDPPLMDPTCRNHVPAGVPADSDPAQAAA